MSLWGGRFSEPTDEDLKKLNDSIGFDNRLYRQDILGSIAYAQAIRDAGVITADECAQIITGLEKVLAEFEQGLFTLVEGDEDIHTAVERRLTELVGPVGGKLHTGRSRNDQIATDMRLWTIDAIGTLDEQLDMLQTALIGVASQHTDTLMPGYTHMQPAQPIVAAHWLMSFFWMIGRDRERLQDAKRRASVSPLGAGALAGNPFAIDRDTLAKQLGLSSYSHNSLDAVSDRDYVVDVLYAAAMLGAHLSRLGEDVIYYSNPLFGYLTLNDRYSTGSSLMPQKRNADPMELARGKAGRLLGNLTGLLGTLKGLPTGYNKDLQEDKEALFDSFDTVMTILPVVTAIVSTLKINADKMYAALTDDMLATELADYLVNKGMTFREAHHIVGEVVRESERQKVGIRSLSMDAYQAISDKFEPDLYEALQFEKAVARKAAAGGTAPEAVRQQITAAKAWQQSFNQE
ncbi:argininosuccinate lyase [Phototrophicus methaneseepsis]|uniref:Argininosuccinate lyase n=1 Tax=Phototrophicus methaneseepsis TaxID=2710758 RepID=A0A7S8E5Z1_9CHLR|nr:argininosuccinate lyase [Phototrophicus methaneseepsis]QPC80996.1 argininosuccinate lyase [Phototrophicus methaneseepsis]